MPSEVIAARVLDLEAIKLIIPQRFPFLMLDRVTKIEPGTRVVATKNLTGNEWFYQGHFPKRAVTPGAMICEAVAQAGIIFFHAAQPEAGDVTYLMGNIKMRFLEPVWPGDQMEIEVTPVRVLSRAGILEAAVRVDGRVVARGEFALAAKPNAEL